MTPVNLRKGKQNKFVSQPSTQNFIQPFSADVQKP